MADKQKRHTVRYCQDGSLNYVTRYK